LNTNFSGPGEMVLTISNSCYQDGDILVISYNHLKDDQANLEVITKENPIRFT